MIKKLEGLIRITENVGYDKKIMNVLEDKPLAPYEIAEQTGIDMNVVWAKISELKKNGLIVNTEEHRRSPNSRKSQTVVKLAKQKNSDNNVNHLKFLMDFFQMNREILIEKNQEFLYENQDKFQEIVELIQNGGAK